jgi:pyruvate/2-oxoglutarate dehydrogenase complex dihydrolipoamide dehydrogenase (E3) component
VDAIPGLAEAQPLTHIEALELDEVPEHLLVIGGGYVGIELSQAMRRFGSKVSVIDRNDRLMPREDEDVCQALRSLVEDEGINVFLHARIERVLGQSGGSVSIVIEQNGTEKTLQGSHVLVATGRTPNTEGLGLELAGVELTDHGYIKVNERLQTTAANIWAMGDCAGSPQFTHIAFDDFRVVYDNLNGGHRTTRNRLISFCMFTDPELARVGRNESEARRDGLEYRVAKMPMADVLRTETVSEPRGFLKMLIGANSDDILGLTAFGFEASEPMVAVQIAMIGGMPYTLLRDAIFTHPTMSEGLIKLLTSVPAKSTPRSA